MVSRGGTAGSVLVVDDDGAVRRMISRILERAGHECHDAADPGAARSLAQAHEFSLVTCDVNMPGGSGLDLVAELRQHHPDLAVVMVSGVDDPHTAATATKLGAFGYVIKPFESNEILISAENALRRRELELENRAHREELERLVARRTSELVDTVDRLSDAERSLRASQEEVIRRLAFVAEFRDPDTGAHISRMARTCEMLAERSGLGSPRAEMIRIASPMHDIGKIGVADQILRKPGPLTESEWDEIRKHPVMGAEILAGSDSELLQLGAVIALSHHERWDGNGYPHRLAGESIPDRRPHRGHRRRLRCADEPTPLQAGLRRRSRPRHHARRTRASFRSDVPRSLPERRRRTRARETPGRPYLHRLVRGGLGSAVLHLKSTPLRIAAPAPRPPPDTHWASPSALGAHGAASSKASNVNGGATVAPTSVHAPSVRADCHAPAGTTA